MIKTATWHTLCSKRRVHQQGRPTSSMPWSPQLLRTVAALLQLLLHAAAPPHTPRSFCRSFTAALPQRLPCLYHRAAAASAADVPCMNLMLNNILLSSLM